MPNSLLIGSPDVNVQAFTCYHLLYHVVIIIVFCLCTYSVQCRVEFVIHYNLIRYAAVITFYVTIVNHYV